MTSKATGPLKGIKVLEFAGIGPGPFACMLLSDMGATGRMDDEILELFIRQYIESVTGDRRREG